MHITDDQICAWLSEKKTITNPKARMGEKAKHTERNFTARGEFGNEYAIFQRQNLVFPPEFSCGIRIIFPSGESITLARYNGPGHPHGNPLEKEQLGFVCHIHKATERYHLAGRKIEGYAEKTDRYNTVDGAFHCLTIDCNIDGLDTQPDEPDLFQNET